MPLKTVALKVDAAKLVLKELAKSGAKEQEPQKSFQAVLKQAGERVNDVARTKNPTGEGLRVHKVAIKQFLNSVEKDTTKLDGMMHTIVQGKSLNQQELLYMQAFSYKVALATELVSKAAETASQAVKTTMQTQV